MSNNKLNVLWTSADREVALKTVFMYAFNSKLNGWWKNVKLIIWGPSAKLLSVDTELQHYIKKMLEHGVDVVACRACADSYGVSEGLEKLGIEVKYMGKPLTELLQANETLLTF